MSSDNDKKSAKPEKKDTKMKEVDLKKTVVKNLVMGGTAGQMLYKNSLDCLVKIFQRDGFLGLYKGLPAQLVGITPEKAIKLTVNDLLRYKFTDKETGEIKVIHEVIAGASAGLSQVVATNPYELVKVRLQTQQGHQRKSALVVVRELGLRGLTVGAPATLLRDVPFSAIYFTLYGNLKKWNRDERGHITKGRLFMCSTLAGSVAAASVTPADVVKTRLQAQTGSVKKYNGLVDCFQKIITEEGVTALFKGTVPRVMIISPLFGITLFTYETLQGFFL